MTRARNWIQDLPTAEAYWINRVLYDTQHSSTKMAAFRADPDAYLGELPLQQAAKAALVENAIGPLYLAGANPYLLRAHCLGLGVSEEAYLDALRAAGESDHG